MSRNEMVMKIARSRGFEDKYTLIIARYAEDPAVTDREVNQMMFDILLGVSTFEE